MSPLVQWEAPWRDTCEEGKVWAWASRALPRRGLLLQPQEVTGKSLYFLGLSTLHPEPVMTQLPTAFPPLGDVVIQMQGARWSQWALSVP